DDRDLVAALGEMPVDAVRRDVEHAVLVPFDRDVVRIVRGVLDLGIRLDPVDALAVLAPERVRVADRGLVHRLVLRVVHVGALGPVGRDVVNRLGHGCFLRTAGSRPRELSSSADDYATGAAGATSRPVSHFGRWRTQSYGALNSWLGKLDASGVLITTN